MDFEFKIKRRANIKRLKISIDENANVLVSSPLLIPKFIIERFIKDKSEWIIETREKVMQKKKYPEFNDELKQEAKNLVMSLLEEVNDIYGFEYKNIRIKNQRSRWGSCSRIGNLNFNYKLLFLPEELARYVVVHEVCHLKELNHGAKFWKLVEKACPNQKELRKELKNY